MTTKDAVKLIAKETPATAVPTVTEPVATVESEQGVEIKVKTPISKKKKVVKKSSEEK